MNRMKLDLILLNVTKNVDNDATSNSTGNSVNQCRVTTTTGNSGSSTCSNLLNLLQDLSESIRCIHARDYLASIAIVCDGDGILPPQAAKKELQQYPTTQAVQQQRLPNTTTVGTSRPKNKHNVITNGRSNNTCYTKNSPRQNQPSKKMESSMTSQATSRTASKQVVPMTQPRSTATTKSTNLPSDENNSTNLIMTTIGKQILKYIKTTDRYMCLASCLLKSRAFHEAYPMKPMMTTTQQYAKSDPNTVSSSPSAISYNEVHKPVNNDKRKHMYQGQAQKSNVHCDSSTTNVINSGICSCDCLCDNDAKDDKPIQLPLIELPRTKHGKPYIPTSGSTPSIPQNNNNSTNNNSNNNTQHLNHQRKLEENRHPLSVSHQYPYVGMIRIDLTVEQRQDGSMPEEEEKEAEPSQQRKTRSNSTSRRNHASKISHSNLSVGDGNTSKDKQQQCLNGSSSSSPLPSNNTILMAGFDIVVFDEINYRLYDSIQDFVNVFRGMFSPQEFKILLDCIDDPEKQLRELYLRWAVKEAYTKALGVGLGFDFSTFQVNLDIERKDIMTNGIVGTAATSCHHPKGKDQFLLWDWLCTFSNNKNSGIDSVTTPSKSNVIGVTGTIHQVKEKTQSPDHYAFFFFPILKGDSFSPKSMSSSSSSSSSSFNPSNAIDVMNGCACACVGPLNAATINAVKSNEASVVPTKRASSTSSLKAAAIAAMNEIECSVEWTDLDHLISWHTSL